MKPPHLSDFVVAHVDGLGPLTAGEALMLVNFRSLPATHQKVLAEQIAALAQARLAQARSVPVPHPTI